jgi:hypothetical protein
MQAGQPGMGKTTFVGNILEWFRQQGSEVSTVSPSKSFWSWTPTLPGDLHTAKYKDGRGNELHYLFQV